MWSLGGPESAAPHLLGQAGATQTTTSATVSKLGFFGTKNKALGFYEEISVYSNRPKIYEGPKNGD